MLIFNILCVFVHVHILTHVYTSHFRFIMSFTLSTPLVLSSFKDTVLNFTAVLNFQKN